MEGIFDPAKVWTYIKASNYFMQEWEQRGLHLPPTDEFGWSNRGLNNNN